MSHEVIAGVNVRLAGHDDLQWCLSVETDIPEQLLRDSISSLSIFVAERDGDLVGYLRLEWFWSRIPYIALIRVEEALRGQGIGKQMLNFLEEHLRAQGHDLLLSSSTANEDRPQHWHRAVGFEECGFIAGLNEDGVGEIFFRKRLNK